MIEQEVLLPGQPAPLAGTLVLPDGGTRAPGVLIVAGSGPTDRNGNQPGLRNDAYRKLAQGLAGCGVASLRADKRGVAASAAAEPDESNLTVDVYVADALRWLDMLRAEQRISSVSLLGHSEGALIATIAAARADVARLVLLAGAGRRASVVLREQLAGVDMAPTLRRRATQMLDLLGRGETTEAPPPKGLGVLFRPSVQPYLVSWFRLDPAVELARTHMPALVVQGTTDLQVGVVDAKALALARGGTRLVVIAGMNHVLRIAPADAHTNYETYSDTSTPLAPMLLPLLCGFLHP